MAECRGEAQGVWWVEKLKEKKDKAEKLKASLDAEKKEKEKEKEENAQRVSSDGRRRRI